MEGVPHVPLNTKVPGKLLHDPVTETPIEIYAVSMLGLVPGKTGEGHPRTLPVELEEAS